MVTQAISQAREIFECPLRVLREKMWSGFELELGAGLIVNLRIYNTE